MSTSHFTFYEIKVILFHMEQPDVRRRLNFDNIDAEMPSPPGSPREGSERNPALSGSDTSEECDTSIDFGETDEEFSSSGEEEGNDPPGYRLLYEGYGDPDRIVRARRGYGIIIARYRDGLTRVARVPVDAIHIAMPRVQIEENRNTQRNEENDRQQE